VVIVCFASNAKASDDHLYFHDVDYLPIKADYSNAALDRFENSITQSLAPKLIMRRFSPDTSISC